MATDLGRRGLRNAIQPVVREISFRSPRLPFGFEGFRILQLSDLHIDGLDLCLDAICDRVSALTFDLCVLTGDYRLKATGSSRKVHQSLERLLGSVHAPYGTLGILGNHDTLEEVGALERMGVRMLMNEAVQITNGSESIWIAGVDDPHYYRCDDLPLAMASVPEEAYTLLLAHSPELAEKAAGRGVSGYLCGHTHGGQVCLPAIGPVLTNARCRRKLAKGRWDHGGMAGYTSTGLGYSGVPVRFRCPPEVVLIDLRCGFAISEMRRPCRVKASA